MDTHRSTLCLVCRDVEVEHPPLRVCESCIENRGRCGYCGGIVERPGFCAECFPATSKAARAINAHMGVVVTRGY